MISVKKLFKAHGRRLSVREVLNGVDLTVDAGEFVCVVGRSGSGKTTMLNILGGLDTAYRGDVVVSARRLGGLSDDELSVYRNQMIGFVFQDFGLVDALDSRENMILPLSFAPATGRVTAAEAGRRTEALLERVGLAGRGSARPAELSGGEQQRLSLARALIGRPRLLLCDELTGNLDTDTGAEVIELLEELHDEEGLTIVAATHDEAVATAAGRVLRLRGGRLVDEGGRK